MKVESPDEIFEDIPFIHQILLGNKVAFEKLVIKYRPMIFALVSSYTQNSADAEDLTQEVFLKAYQNLSSLEEPGRFSFWLRQIAKNHCTDWLRQRRENHLSFEELPVAEFVCAPSAEETALEREFLKIVRQAIDSLQKIERKLLLARYLEDASYEQLQEEHGLSYFAVAHRLQRAKQKVRETVQKLLGGFCALPRWEVLEKLFLGGIKVMKLSLKTKLVTVVTVAVLGFGGAVVWHWHSKEVPQKNTVVHQQEMEPKKATSASAEKKVVIEKPAPKTAPQVEPAKPPVQAEEEQEEISDEEWVQLEQWLAESEEEDEVADKVAERTLTPEEQRKVAIFAELATILPRFKELDKEFMQISQEFSSYNEKYIGKEFDDQGRRVSDVRDEFDAKIEKLRELIRPYLEKIDELFPGSITYGTYRGVKVITGFTTTIMYNYFAPKNPPWDGNPDYFAAKEGP